MKLFVTGASGFLGQYVVAEALRQGHQVKALMRSPAKLSWSDHPGVEIVQADLQGDRLTEAVRGVDAVVHLAAVMRGDYATQYAGTVTATENLLDAMTQARVDRLIAISTFSVFDYLNIPAGEIIDEDSAIESNPSQRDGYAQTKLIQEQRVRAFGSGSGRVTILRPSMIYGRDHLWNAHLGIKASDRLWLQIGANGWMPITYVENCAEAIVLATQDSAIGQTLNIIDDKLPSQSAYIRHLAQQISPPPKTVMISWSVLQFLAKAAAQTNAIVFKNRLKLPGLMVPARLQARFKPFRYSNDRAKQVLGWRPRYSFVEAVDRSCGSLDLLSVPAQPDPAAVIS
jgi:2-alkyl-3-oxoalkanoate reductase